MPLFDTRQIATLVSQLGGDRQTAAARLSKVKLEGSGLVDTGRHAHLLRSLGVSPHGLASGQYERQLAAQKAADTAAKTAAAHDAPSRTLTSTRHG